MDPIFTEEQLNRMSSRDMRSLLKIMMQHQQKQEEMLQKQEETLQKQESRIRLLEEQKHRKNGLALPVKNTRRVMSSWAFLTKRSRKRI